MNIPQVTASNQRFPARVSTLHEGEGFSERLYFIRKKELGGAVGERHRARVDIHHYWLLLFKLVGSSSACAAFQGDDELG